MKSFAALSSTLSTGHKAKTVDVNTQGHCLLNTVQLTDNASANRQVEFAQPEEKQPTHNRKESKETESGGYNAIQYE